MDIPLTLLNIIYFFNTHSRAWELRTIPKSVLKSFRCRSKMSIIDMYSFLPRNNYFLKSLTLYIHLTSDKIDIQWKKKEESKKKFWLYIYLYLLCVLCCVVVVIVIVVASYVCVWTCVCVCMAFVYFTIYISYISIKVTLFDQMRR